MKKVLIISPYFPPSNAADMQRIRTSLPYFAKFGWTPTVVTVDEKYSDLPKDKLLSRSIPPEVKVYKVSAFDKRWTSKVGLGSIALRSMRFFRQKVNDILSHERFDLVYFSTTQFPVCILGAYWKKKFKVPYVIDMQDPWHSEYYKDKPKEQRPAKYWFSYRLNKTLEPVAIKNADGLISVSESYINDLKARYSEIKALPAVTITFGSFAPDVTTAENNEAQFPNLLKPGYVNIVYIGRGGADMHRALEPLFSCLQNGLRTNKATFCKFRLYFIGTSYAPAGKGKSSITQLAVAFGIGDIVTEITERISYYHTLLTLKQADGIFIPGSDDPKYTASKIFPYLLLERPIVAIFNEKSSALGILKEYGVKDAYSYQQVTETQINTYLDSVANRRYAISYTPEAVRKYSAEQMTFKQCSFFDLIVNGKN